MYLSDLEEISGWIRITLVSPFRPKPSDYAWYDYKVRYNLVPDHPEYLPDLMKISGWIRMLWSLRLDQSPPTTLGVRGGIFWFRIIRSTYSPDLEKISGRIQITLV